MNTDIVHLIKVCKRFIVHQYEQIRMKTRKYELIKTCNGTVRGLKRKNTYGREHNYYAFEGIPFAKPPIGELRFREPQPPEPWHGVLNCTDNKSKPMQVNPIFLFTEGSEDCLYLNVYAKRLHSQGEAPLPVMVYIYGGSFNIGEASRDLHAPDYFMMRDIVLVTFNYRLGIFGFLCLDDPQLNIPGNAGLKDQLMALKWIKNNIHNFNGDPNNITVFGQSAGAFSTHMLMLSPQAKGLFHKAILQSGCALCPWGCAEKHDWGYKKACKLGYEGANTDYDILRFLMKQPSRRLVDRFNDSILSNDDLVQQKVYAFAPVVEPYLTKGCIVDKPFKELMPDAWGNEIPVILGNTSDEGLLFYCLTLKRPQIIELWNKLDFWQLLPDDVKRAHNRKDLEIMAHKLKLGYFESDCFIGKEHRQKCLNIMAHRAFQHPLYRALHTRLAYASKVSTYYYSFHFDSNDFISFRQLFCSDPNGRGACHTDELCYLFRNMLVKKFDTSSREFKCIQRMIGMWYNFALNSNPNCKEILPTIWQEVADAEKPIECLVIDDELEMKILPHNREMKVWSSLYTKESFI